jgi:hypothetical protein
MDIPETQTLFGIRYRTKTNKTKITTEKIKKMRNKDYTKKNGAEPMCWEGVSRFCFLQDTCHATHIVKKYSDVSDFQNFTMILSGSNVHYVQER